MMPGDVSEVRERETGLAYAAPFDNLPSEMVVRAFGVDYGHVRTREGGDLYVTRFGWPHLAHLMPENWYADEWFAKRGERLRGASGTAYHVGSKPVRGKQLDMVVKFSRVAQDVPIVVDTSFPDDMPAELIATARFNSPMEEFGLVMELRRSPPRDLRILTQRPLAIYAPPKQYELWQLGRKPIRFQNHLRLLAEDQEDAVKAIEFDIRRVYALLYGWIKGKDAEERYSAGEISEREFTGLTPRVIDELRCKGFRVLDNKPKHFILRRCRRDDGLLRRSGKLVYGLVDFELLQRSSEHEHQFKAQQRERYWHLQSQQRRTALGDLPSHLKLMTVFGVKYLFGTTPGGGKIWVVGQTPDLFDYFLPDRWRRTPRVKLSLSNEVYRTRTRDNIHVVYRRSRVGARPRFDPLFRFGKRIREHGFNSPFEEMAIAERLRQMGISTTRPRAICRTGHHSTKAAYLRDGRRYVDQADLVTPGEVPERVLSPNHDYYTIWDYYRGIDPEREFGRRTVGVDDLRGACDAGLLDKEEYDHAAKLTRDRLHAIGFAEESLDDHEFVVLPTEEGVLRRDESGEVEVRLCIDSLTAYEYDLLSENAYRELVRRLGERLRAVDCEKLDLSGKHLLLSMNPDGRFHLDESGEPHVTLCNFELIRGLYRPIR